ncbi:MAG: glycosyltransferase, partial [Myxococcota bacterium]|nr:glycosyltransferase [Myxococcota bacterium]
LSMLLVAVGLLVAAKTPRLRLVIVFLSLSASLRYVLYRGAETLVMQEPGDMIVSCLLFGAELYAVITMVGGYFQTAIVRRNRPLALDLPADELPSVDVFIPTYNEELHVLRPTVLGALSMDYANKQVHVLDDGCRPEVADLCRRVGANYIAREDSFGAKAGNINNALPQTDGALIAFFDADHVPVRGFLKATVGFFLENDRLSLVQTPHHFYNPDPFVRNLHMGAVIPPEQHLFYHGIQLGNDFWNSAFFCGSCAVIRRQALEEVGGVSHETVTEDAHTALQMHASGWDSLYLDIPLAAGLATETYAAHIGQRIRWARGMAQIVRLDNPLLKPGLSLAQRVNYFNAAWHFFFGLPRMIFVITPAMYLLFDLHPVDADVREVLVYAIPHLVLVGLASVTVNRNVRHSLWPEVYEIAIAPYTALVTTLAMLLPRRGKFNVTDKGAVVGATTFDLRHALPLLIMMGILIAGLIMTPIKMFNQPLDTFTIAVAAIWNGYNVVVLGAAVLAAVERRQRRRTHRLSRKLRVTAAPLRGNAAAASSFQSVEGEALDVSQGGVRFRVAGSVAFPERFTATLVSHFGRKVDIDVAVRAVLAIDDQTEVRGEFIAPDDDALHALSSVLFSDSDNWVGDRFRYDTWSGSFMSLIVAIGATIFRRPRWIAAFNAWRASEEAPLIPGSEDEACYSCGALVVEGSTHCEKCGTPVWTDDELKARPVPAPKPREGIRPTLLPVAILTLAVLLAVGWTPVVQLFSAYMPMQRWEKVSYQTRLGDLNKAYDALRRHTDLLEDSVAGGRATPREWSNDLWTIQRDYELYRGAEKRAEVQEAHALLSSLILELADAEKLHRNGAARSVVQQRLDTIVEHLDSAGRSLGRQVENDERSE